MSRKPKTARETSPFEEISKQRSVRVKHELGKSATQVSIGEDLLAVLHSPLKKTFEAFLSELANLTALADANRSVPTDHEPRGTADPGVPSFKSVWAERRLGQVDQLLWRESEALSAWLNRPSDPHQRRDVCPKCGTPTGVEDVFCRHCAVKVGAADPKLKLRVRCVRSQCDRSGRSIPKFVQAGRSLIELVVCSGLVDGEPCNGRLRDF